MGFPVALFVDHDADEEWICAICQQIVEEPIGTPCGHSFCFVCLQQWLVDNEDCPTCRTKGLSLEHQSNTNPRNCFEQMAVKQFLLKLPVRCGKINCCEETTTPAMQDGPASARRRLNNGGVASVEEEQAGSSCTWTGKLEHWEKHCQQDCDFFVTQCSVPGCDHSCPRKEMPKHMMYQIARHTDLLVSEKVKAVEAKYEERLVDLQVTSFCQQWIRSKPHALFDFCVYRCGHISSHWSNETTTTSPKLLVGIPGPLNTVWEGGMFPVTMEWHSTNKAPRFRFPTGFFHCNVYPSGTICISSLMEEDGWTPHMTIPELLFSIQQLLAHPDFDSPAQSEAYHAHANDPKGYDERLQKQTQQYSAESDFLAVARLSFGEERIPSAMKLVHDQERHRAHYLSGAPQNNLPLPKPKLPKAKEGCGCSCCAWGATFWDKKREMRFIFGVGG